MRLSMKQFFLFFFFIFSLPSAFAADYYWREHADNSNFNSTINWVNDPAYISAVSVPEVNTPTSPPGAADDVYFTGPSNITIIGGTGDAVMRSLNCSAGVNYILDANADIYGDISSNGRFQIRATVTMKGSNHATVYQGSTSSPFSFGSSFTGFRIQKDAGVKVTFTGDFRNEGPIRHESGTLVSYSNNITVTRYVKEAWTLGSLDLAGSILTLTDQSRESIVSGITNFNCSVICFNPTILVEPLTTSVRYESLTLNHPDSVSIGINRAIPTFEFGELKVNTPHVVLGDIPDENTTQDAYISDITIGTLNLQQASNIIINKGFRYNPFYVTGLNINAINVAYSYSPVSYLNRSSLIGFSPVKLKASASTITTNGLIYQNIQFDQAGALVSAPIADNGGQNRSVGAGGGGIAWAGSATGQDYYWTGGSGDWDDPNHWLINNNSPATSSPTAADNVFFTSTSFASAGEKVTLTRPAICNNITWTDPAKKGSLVSLRHRSDISLSVQGNVDFSGAASISPNLYFLGFSSSGSYTLNSGNLPIYTSSYIFFRNQGTYTLMSHFLMIEPGQVTHSAGILKTNGKLLDIGRFVSSYPYPEDATRYLNLVDSEIRSYYNTMSHYYRPNNVWLNRSGLDGYDFTGSHFFITGPQTDLANNRSLRADGEPWDFNDITFDNYAGTSSNDLDFNRFGHTINKLTFKGSSSISRFGFTVNTLVLTPYKTYTFPHQSYYDDRLVIIKGDLISTSGCETITISGLNNSTQTALLKNESNKAFSIQGGVIANFTYLGRDDVPGDVLTVPEGIDNGDNSANIVFTPRTSRTFYWIGGSGNWSDGNNWSFSSGGSACGCVPSMSDDVYFDENSFSATGQTVLIEDAAIYVHSMYWKPAAGAKEPIFDGIGDVILSGGSLELSDGMNIRGGNFKFEGKVGDVQTIKTNGLRGFCGTGTIRVNFSVTGDGRFELLSDILDFFGFNFRGGSLYTNGFELNPREFEITQKTSANIIDLSTSTLGSGACGWGSATTTLNIKDGTTFISQNAHLAGYSNVVYINNDSPIRFKTLKQSAGFLFFGSTVPGNTISADTITITHSTGLGFEGFYEADVLDIQASTVRIAPGSGYTINKAVIQSVVNSTPCDLWNINGFRQDGNYTGGIVDQAYLKFKYCYPVLYFYRLENINIEVDTPLVPVDGDEDCPLEPPFPPAKGDPTPFEYDELTVWGEANNRENNTNIHFRDPAEAGDYTYPSRTYSCTPQILDLVFGERALTYQWSILKPGGDPMIEADYVDILPAHGGQLRTLEVDVAGTYQLIVSYGPSCPGKFKQTIDFEEVFIWTAAGTPSDWNDQTNWNVMDGIPDPCSYVIIPGGLSHYPILVPEDEFALPDPILPASCAIIDFRFGGETKNTNLLHYERAKVQFGIESNQWYMFSAPLQQMYSGDFYVNHPNPKLDYPDNALPTDPKGMLVYMMHFNIPNYQTGVDIEYDWNEAFNNHDIEIQAGQGLALFANPRNSGWADHEDLTFDFPKKDMYHYYYGVYDDSETRGRDLDRSKSYRFIYENDIDAGGLVTLNHSGSSDAGKPILIGNPFMSHLDFNKFATRNNGLIYDEYKLAYGVASADGYVNDLVTYKKVGGVHTNTDPEDYSLTNMIPPMQSFIVTSRVSTSPLVLQAHVEADTESVPGATLRNDSQKSLPVLGITAQRNNQKSKAILVYLDGASSAYDAEEDSRKLFPSEASAPVFVYLLSSDGYSLDINTIGDLSEIIPVGIRTSQKGKITLNFTGMEEFKGGYFCLHDTKENKIIDLSQTDSYSFLKLDDEVYLNDRFYLTFKSATMIDRQANLGILVSNPTQNMIRIFSPSILKEVEILDAEGRTLLQDQNPLSSSLDYQMNHSGIYLVKVSGEQFTEIRKVIVK